MFCGKCGAQVKEGEQFCSSCGALMTSGDPSLQIGQQQDSGQKQFGITQPPKKKSLKALWISIAAVLVIAIAAVVLFVYPGVLNGGVASAGLLSGNTTQTKFVNDNVKVFEDAFSGLGNPDNFPNVNKQPFDITGNTSITMMGTNIKETMDMAYDNKTLGITADVSGQKVTLLLDGDILYVQANDQTYGINLNVSSDLTKSMALDDRMNAILQGIMNNNASSASKADYQKLAELFVNSIDQKCFSKSDSMTTLTLKKQDVIDLLNTFADKLDKDSSLKQSLTNMVKDIGGTSDDISEDIRSAATDLKNQNDFTLTWNLSYTKGSPTSISMMVDDGSGSGPSGFDFSYSKKTSENEINISVTDSGQKAAEVDMTITKNGNGYDFDGNVTVSGQSVELKGNVNYKGNDITGNMTLAYGGQDIITMDFNETVKTGMPATPVKEDSRFTIDTKNATMENLSDLVNNLKSSAGSIPGLGS